MRIIFYKEPLANTHVRPPLICARCRLWVSYVVEEGRLLLSQMPSVASLEWLSLGCRADASQPPHHPLPPQPPQAPQPPLPPSLPSLQASPPSPPLPSPALPGSHAAWSFWPLVAGARGALGLGAPTRWGSRAPGPVCQDRAQADGALGRPPVVTRPQAGGGGVPLRVLLRKTRP